MDISGHSEKSGMYRSYLCCSRDYYFFDDCVEASGLAIYVISVVFIPSWSLCVRRGVCVSVVESVCPSWSLCVRRESVGRRRFFFGHSDSY